MQKIGKKHGGFSLIELLVALSILAVVAAIIVPRFLNVRSQADTVMAKQLASQLTASWYQWRDLGGINGGNPTGYDGSTICALLTSAAGPTQVNGGSGGYLSDVSSPPAQNIRISNGPSGSWTNNVLSTGNMLIIYNMTANKFVGCPKSTIGMPDTVTVTSSGGRSDNTNGTVSIYSNGFNGSDGKSYPPVSYGTCTVTP